MAAGERASGFKLWATVALAAVVHRIAFWTYRCTYRDELYTRRRDRGEDVRCIYAVWHGDLWFIMGALKHQELSVIVSSSRDGEIITRVLEGYGFLAVRGSSTRGAARALLEFTRAARERDGDLVITVDGPKGPVGSVKDGIVFAASRSGLPIVPLGVHVDRFWRAGSWDRMLVGKPFTRVRYALGPPIHVPTEFAKADLAGVWIPRVAEALSAAHDRAADERGVPPRTDNMAVGRASPEETPIP